MWDESMPDVCVFPLGMCVFRVGVQGAHPKPRGHFTYSRSCPSSPLCNCNTLPSSFLSSSSLFFYLHPSLHLVMMIMLLMTIPFLSSVVSPHLLLGSMRLTLASLHLPIPTLPLFLLFRCNMIREAILV